VTTADRGPAVSYRRLDIHHISATRRTFPCVSEEPYERIGREIPPRGPFWLTVIGMGLVISGLIPCVFVPPVVAVFVVPWAGLGALLVWIAWHLRYRPPGVLVADHDDVFVIRGELGGTRRVAWRSVARFRAADAEGGYVDLRDGSSVRMSSASGEAIERLNAILERRGGAQDWPEIPRGDVRIGPEVDHVVAVGAIAVGAMMLVGGTIGFAAADGTDALFGLALAVFGVVFVYGGWYQVRRPGGVLVREYDDLFVIETDWRRSYVAWASVARFRAAADGVGFVDLRDGSSIRLFGAGEPGPEFDRCRDEICGYIDRLNAILEHRRGRAGVPRASQV
jgi:hypothetical protein